MIVTAHPSFLLLAINVTKTNKMPITISPWFGLPILRIMCS